LKGKPSEHADKEAQGMLKKNKNEEAR